MTAPAAYSPLSRVLDLLPDARRTGSGWQARCPAHDDRNPSLSLHEGDDGRVLLKCFGGCETESIVAALGLAMHDLFPDTTKRDPIPLHPRTPPVRPVAMQEREKTHATAPGVRHFIYNDRQRVRREDYQEADEETGELHWKKRIRPEYLAGGKWHTGDGAEPIERVYRREDLARPDWQEDTVLVVEGEATADALRAAGFLAVTWRGGANRTAKAIPQLVDALAGREVVLIPDADAPGREAMRLIGNALAGKGDTTQ